MDYYGTEQGFIDYNTARGRDVSTYDTAQILTSLLVASEWLDGSFREQFSRYSYKSGQRAQLREWPRTAWLDRYGYSVAAGIVPIEVENATYEATLRHLQDETALLVDYTPNKYKSVSIDGAVSVTYNQLDASTVQTKFPIIGQILEPLIGGRHVSSLVGSLSRV